MEKKINSKTWEILKANAEKYGVSVDSCRLYYLQALKTADPKKTYFELLQKASEKKQRNAAKKDNAEKMLTIYNSGILNGLLQGHIDRYRANAFSLSDDFDFAICAGGERCSFNGIFSGITQREFFLLSAIYTAVAEATAKEGGYKIALKNIFNLLHPVNGWDRVNDAEKENFVQEIKGLTEKFSKVYDGIYSFGKVKTQISRAFFLQGAVTIDGDFLSIKAPKVMGACDLSKRKIAIPRKMLAYGRHSEGDFARLYIAYRVALSGNDKNSMRPCIDLHNLEGFGTEINHTEINNYFNYLQKQNFIENFAWEGTKKISWTCKTETKLTGNEIKISDCDTMPEMPQEIQDRAQKIASYNNFIKTHKVTDGNGTRLSTALQSVFCRGDFNHGGRLYTDKNGYQGLSQEERHNIKIDGAETVELDYKSLHINMLYNLEGKTLTADPYDFWPVRQEAKKTLLIALNAKNFEEAIGAIAHALGIDNAKARFLLEKAFERHAEIKKYFCSDCGVMLQKMDSDMAIEIIAKATANKMPVLCMHDSFICKKSDEMTVKKLMKTAYENAVGFEPLAIENK